jgi:hypothetical protein
LHFNLEDDVMEDVLALFFLEGSRESVKDGRDNIKALKEDDSGILSSDVKVVSLHLEVEAETSMVPSPSLSISMALSIMPPPWLDVPASVTPSSTSPSASSSS